MIILPDDDQDPLLSVSPSVKIARSFATQPGDANSRSSGTFFLFFFSSFGPSRPLLLLLLLPPLLLSYTSFLDFVLYLLPNRIHGANALTIIVFLAVTGIP